MRRENAISYGSVFLGAVLWGSIGLFSRRLSAAFGKEAVTRQGLTGMAPVPGSVSLLTRSDTKKQEANCHAE